MCQPRICYRLLGITSRPTRTIGPTTIIDIAQRVNNDVRRGRSSSDAQATNVAPVVEKGDEGLTADARGKIRTAALWGLGTRQANGEPLLHDGGARTIEEAINKHRNTAAQETEKFQRLPERERTRLLKSLRSL